MTHIMVDLETWGTQPGCAIRSIGACAFDPALGVVRETFYRNVSDESCVGVGLVQDAATLQWWSKQSEEARAALRPFPHPIWAVLDDFSAWYANVSGAEVWSYGANADIPWLEAAYAACDRSHPWHYRSPRCARTLLALAGVEISRAKGVHHNALDDARNQVDAVREALSKLAPPDQSGCEATDAAQVDGASSRAEHDQ